MPELPEVEVVRRGLIAHVQGATIGQTELTGARVTRRHLPGPVDLLGRLAGARITGTGRRGKFLWLTLDEADRGALLVHLGMSGQLRIVSPSAAAPRHTAARWSFTDGRDDLVFADQRTFGGIWWSPVGHDGTPTCLDHIARDPFDPQFDPVAVSRLIRGRDRAVKALILDQAIVSGVGNIYADESLWRVGIHGARPGRALRHTQVLSLLTAAREVMDQALAEGGTSFDALYVHVNGESGYFDRELAAYGQEGRPCQRCGTPIRREHFMNRSSFFCPRCQLAPRRGN